MSHEIQRITQQVDRILATLRHVIESSELNQQDIQKALGWGRTYITQLLNKQKALRISQILQILEVVEMEPTEFFNLVFQDPLPTRRPFGIKSLVRQYVFEFMEAHTQGRLDLEHTEEP